MNYRVYLAKYSYIRVIKLFLIFEVNFPGSFSSNALATSGLKLVGKSIFAGHGSFALRITAAPFGVALTVGSLLKESASEKNTVKDSSYIYCYFLEKRTIGMTIFQNRTSRTYIHADQTGCAYN